jgi:hypothetical protein
MTNLTPKQTFNNGITYEIKMNDANELVVCMSGGPLPGEIQMPTTMADLGKINQINTLAVGIYKLNA